MEQRRRRILSHDSEARRVGQELLPEFEVPLEQWFSSAAHFSAFVVLRVLNGVMIDVDFIAAHRVGNEIGDAGLLIQSVAMLKRMSGSADCCEKRVDSVPPARAAFSRINPPPSVSARSSAVSCAAVRIPRMR